MLGGCAHDARVAPDPSRPASRVVHCADALAWLRDNQLPDACAVVTSLPDVSELRGMALPAWREWFMATAELLLRKAPDRAPVVFYQSDIRRDGQWVDKGHLVQCAADRAVSVLQWHRIVCRAPAGQQTGGRPGYAHLLCFARGWQAPHDDGCGDVLPQMGAMTWPRAMGLAACEFTVRWLRAHTGVRVVVDPFCGVGTVLAAANRCGLDAVGVERSTSRARRARELQV